jgi:tripartite-type tricarboxylate transporter receptor subunit TctC
MKSLRVKILLTIGALTCAAVPAAAQSYPQKPVRMIMPVSAGSGSDVIGRIIATGMSEHFGQQVVVDNRAGAAGNIGAEAAARAAADGYNVLFAFVGLAANAVLYENLRYDVLRDFAPVTLLGSSAAIVVVHPSLPVKSIAELVKLAKQKPGAINYASGGAGTPTYIGAELFKRQAGIDLLHIPYRAGGEALTSVIAGETGVYFAPLASTLSYLKQGRLRALAVTSTRRLGLLPQYPTVAELGYPDYESGFWHGLLVPAKTPREIIIPLRNAAVQVLNQPAVAQRLVDLGYVSYGTTPEEFGVYLKSEINKLRNLLKGLKLNPD